MRHDYIPTVNDPNNTGVKWAKRWLFSLISSLTFALPLPFSLSCPFWKPWSRCLPCTTHFFLIWMGSLHYSSVIYFFPLNVLLNKLRAVQSFTVKWQSHTVQIIEETLYGTHSMPGRIPKALHTSSGTLWVRCHFIPIFWIRKLGTQRQSGYTLAFYSWAILSVQKMIIWALGKIWWHPGCDTVI